MGDNNELDQEILDPFFFNWTNNLTWWARLIANDTANHQDGWTQNDQMCVTPLTSRKSVPKKYNLTNPPTPCLPTGKMRLFKINAQTLTKTHFPGVNKEDKINHQTPKQRIINVPQIPLVLLNPLLFLLRRTYHVKPPPPSQSTKRGVVGED